MCLHPRQPIVALVGQSVKQHDHITDTLPHQYQQCCCCLQSVSGIVAEFDLISGCKLGSTEAGGTPISIAYTSDASLLIAVLQV